MRNLKTLIAVPVYDTARPETMQSIYNLKIPAGMTSELSFMRGYTVDQSRNLLVAKSLEENYDYTFFVDGDVILPPDALERLLKAGSPVASGWYVKKIPGKFVPELYREKNGKLENITGLPQDTLLPVAACGFGCVLVNNEVFKALGQGDWFEYVQRSGGVTCSEDITFCVKAAAKGFGVTADTGLRCGHIGQAVF